MIKNLNKYHKCVGFMLKTMKSPRLNEVKLGWEDDIIGSRFEMLCQVKIFGLKQGKLFWF